MAVVEQHRRVVFLAVDAGDVNHGEVHADVADDRRRLPVDPETGLAIAQLSTQSVSVTYRNHCYPRWFGNLSVATVTDGLARSVFLNLLDCRLQRHHVVQLATVFVDDRHAIHTDAQTHHIILIISKSGDAGGIQKMTHYLVRECRHNLRTHQLELPDLMLHKIVFLRHVARGKMREDTHNSQIWISFHTLNQGVDFFWKETETVHSSVDFDMYPDRLVERSVQLIYGVFQLREATEAVDVGFKVVEDDCVECVGLRCHHHDWQFYAAVAQVHTLVGIRNSKIINMMECESVRHLVVAAAVCERLHHHHHLGVFFQLAAIIVEVFYQVVEVDFEHRLMRLLL